MLLLQKNKVDSVLGATVQKTLYSKKRRMVVSEGEDKDAVAIGSGWDILDNHQVSSRTLWKTDPTRLIHISF